MKKSYKKIKAFTMMEMIIYIAISAITLVAIVSFSWNIIDSNVQVGVSSELTSNARFVMGKFTDEVRAADAVVSGSSVFNINPGKLTLDLAGSGTDLIFDTYSKNINAGNGSLTITKLRMQKGVAAPVDITSDSVDVSNLVFKNLTRATEPENIRLEFTLDFVNPGNDPVRDKSINIKTSAAIRKN